MTLKKPYFGWIIVATSFVAYMFMTGFFSYSFGILVTSIQETFDSSRAEVMVSITVASLFGLLLSPPLGQAADKWSVRKLMILGAIAGGSGLIALSYAGSILQFIILFALVTGLGNLLLGPLCVTTIISRWFTGKRGLAIGLAAIGTSAGGAILPQLTTYWMGDTNDWRNSIFNTGLCMLLIVLPLIVLFMRDWPADADVEPQGKPEPDASKAEHAVASAPDKSQSKEWSTQMILRHTPFWLASISLGLIFMVYSALISNLPAYATGLGVSTRDASLLISSLAVMGAIGKLIFGFLVDRIDHRLSLFAAILLVAAGLVIYSLEPPYMLMLIGSLIVGLATGGLMPVWGVVVGKFYGTVSYGRAMGLMMPIIAILVMPGFVIMGAIYDHYESYRLGFLLFLGLLGISAILNFAMPNPNKTQSAK